MLDDNGLGTYMTANQRTSTATAAHEVASEMKTIFYNTSGTTNSGAPRLGFSGLPAMTGSVKIFMIRSTASVRTKFATSTASKTYLTGVVWSLIHVAMQVTLQAPLLHAGTSISSQLKEIRATGSRNQKRAEAV